MAGRNPCLRCLFGTSGLALAFSLFLAPSVGAQDSGDTTAAVPKGPASAPESRARVLAEVPFVSWEEAAGWDYPSKDVMNPSVSAVFAMVLGSWGLEPRYDKSTGEFSGIRSIPGWKVERQASPGSLEDLKASIDRGIPVIITAALIPLGHPLAGGAETGLEMGFLKVPTAEVTGCYSGTLGKLVSLAGHRAILQEAGLNPVKESMSLAARLVVGYDDAKEVVLIHDPTFGPAWEVGYEDFDAMWGATDHAWTLAYSESLSASPNTAEGSGGFRPRSAEELAVEHYVYGYALSSRSELTEGEKRFRAGLDLPGTSAGMRYLLLEELALNLAEQRRFDEAVTAAEAASELIPQSAEPKTLLARIYGSSSVQDAKKKAKEAKKAAEKLVKDSKARDAVAAAVPCYFWVKSLSAVRGWCGA